MKKNKIILIEGCDVTGKSTFCNEFCKIHNYQYIHLSKADDAIKFYDNFIPKLKQMYNDNNKYIIDRMYISNYIYGKIFNNQNILTNEQLEEVKKYIDLIIFALPKDKKKVLENFSKMKKERSEMYDTVDKVYDLYLKIYNKKNNPLIRNKKIIRYDMFDYPLNSFSRKNFIKNILDM